MTSAFGPSGAPASADDSVRRLVVADSDRQAPAKLVDLDPQQQGASTIWGLEVRLADSDGRTRLVGRFAPASFTGLWVRAAAPAPGFFGFGAEYQSVLTDLEWDSVGDSEMLSALKAAADASGRLSIKFNVDGYVNSSRSPEFTRGRLVGTLGPAEPASLSTWWSGADWSPVRSRPRASSSPPARSTSAARWWTSSAGHSPSTWAMPSRPTVPGAGWSISVRSP